MTDKLTVGDKPIDAYRFAVLVVEDYDGNINIGQVTGCNTPPVKYLRQMLANASQYIHDQFILDGLASIVDEMKKDFDNTKEQLLQIQVSNLSKENLLKDQEIKELKEKLKEQ